MSESPSKGSCPWPILAVHTDKTHGTVYGLVDSRAPGEVYYVGQSKTPTRRLVEHVARDSRLYLWVWKVLCADAEIWMVELERCKATILERRERTWIAHFVGLGQAKGNIAHVPHAASPETVRVPLPGGAQERGA